MLRVLQVDSLHPFTMKIRLSLHPVLKQLTSVRKADFHIDVQLNSPKAETLLTFKSPDKVMSESAVYVILLSLHV